MLTNRELVWTESGTVEAVFDVSQMQTAAIEQALTYYRRVRFAFRELTDADSAIALNALNAVCAVCDRLVAGDGHAVFRLPTFGVQTLSEAVGIYLAERDVESYQSPEERARIAVMGELSDPLRELVRDMRQAESQPSAELQLA